MKKSWIILAVSLVILAIGVYGIISLYSKLNKVDELNQRIEETARNEDSQVSVSDQAADQPAAQDEGENEAAAVVDDDEQTPEPSEEPGGEAPTTPSPSATPTSKQTPVHVEEGQKPADDAAASEDNAQKKKEIDAAVTAEMEQLRASCQATSKSLVEQISSELSGDKEATLKTIQDKYLTKVFAAEADCDARFNQLLSSAQSEYAAADLNVQALPDWSAQYESAKGQARADALAAIANSMPE